MKGNTCLLTGRTYSELDFFNIGTDERDDWKPFVNEEAYHEWMDNEGRELPALQS